MRVNFNATEHGFAFSNSFVNALLQIPALGVDITTRGRCGGMAAAAMDYWHARLAVPSDGSLPQDGTVLADYVYSRLMDTFVDNGAKFIQYATSLDHPTWLRGKGVARMTREDELPRLRAQLDRGQPVLLGLTQARSVDRLGDDHQVVAYGYEQGSRYTTVFVYDNNNPGAEVRLRLTTVDDPAERTITSSNGSTWRGLFVGSYTPKVPSFVADGRLTHDSTDPRIYVIRGGGAFWIPSPAEMEACGFSWKSVVSMKDGSMRHVSTYPANGTLVRERSTAPVYIVFGGKAFHIPSPQVFDALKLRWDSVREVPLGSLGGLRQVPRDRTLVRELSAAPVYVVQSGRLRHVTSPEVMSKYGYEWAGVCIVPDGALAGLPVGLPLT